MGNEGEMEGEDALASSQAQHQTVRGSSRNSEQRDPKEKGPREAVEGIQTFCKLVTQPDFFFN